MVRYAAARIAWMVPTLFGISLLTFLMLDLVPLDRAEAAVARADMDDAHRIAAVEELRKRYGLVDPETGDPLSLWQRYGNTLAHIFLLDFAGSVESGSAFRERFFAALFVSLLIGSLALVICLGIGIPLGARIGMKRGGAADRVCSGVLLVGYALPEFLIATLLLLALGGGAGPSLLPATGLRSAGADAWSTPAQVWDLLKHLVMPVSTLALAPTAIVLRHVRESVGRAARSDFALAMQGLGVDERQIRRRVLRNALTAVVTQAGVLVPALLAGSVVVEQVFMLPGLGRLGFHAVAGRDVDTVMAVALFTAIIVMFGLLGSDLLLRRLDPRVELR